MIEIFPEIRAGNQAFVAELPDELFPFRKRRPQQVVKITRGFRLPKLKIELPFRQFPARPVLPELPVQNFFGSLRKVADQSPVVITDTDLVDDPQTSQLRIPDQRNPGITVRAAIEPPDPSFHISLDIRINHHQQLDLMNAFSFGSIRNFSFRRAQRRIHNLIGYINPLLFQGFQQIIQFFQCFVAELQRALLPIHKQRFTVLPTRRKMMKPHHIDSQRGELCGKRIRLFFRLPVKNPRRHQIDTEPADLFPVRKNKIPVPDRRPAEFSGRLVIEKTVIRHRFRRDGTDRKRNSFRGGRLRDRSPDPINIHHHRSLTFHSHVEKTRILRNPIGTGKRFPLSSGMPERHRSAILAIRKNVFPLRIQKNQPELSMLRVPAGRIIQFDFRRNSHRSALLQFCGNRSGNMIIGTAPPAEFHPSLRRIETGPDQLPVRSVLSKRKIKFPCRQNEAEKEQKQYRIFHRGVPH